MRTSDGIISATHTLMQSHRSSICTFSKIKKHTQTIIVTNHELQSIHTRMNCMHFFKCISIDSIDRGGEKYTSHNEAN